MHLPICDKYSLSQSLYRKIAILFPNELHSERAQISKLIQTKIPDLKEASESYVAKFDEILDALKQKQLLDTLFYELFTHLLEQTHIINALFQTYAAIPRIAAVILLKRIRIAQEWIVWDESLTHDLKNSKIAIKEYINLSTLLFDLQKDTLALRRQCKHQSKHHFFSTYHIDASTPSPPDMMSITQLLETPFLVYQYLAQQEEAYANLNEDDAIALLSHQR